MPVLPTLLTTLTLMVVGTCVRLCARTAERHRNALLSGDELRALRRLCIGTEPLPAEPADEHAERVESRVVREVLTAPSRPLAVLAMNELTAEVTFAIEDARTLPPALARISLLSGTALGLVTMASGLREGRGGEVAVWGSACVVLGVLGWVGCSSYARIAKQAAEKRRDAARELIRALEPRLPAGGS